MRSVKEILQQTLDEDTWVKGHEKEILAFYSQPKQVKKPPRKATVPTRKRAGK